MKTTTGARLGVQVWQSRNGNGQPNEDDLKPIEPRYEDWAWVKPANGFWTSSPYPTGEYPSYWFEWCHVEEFNDEKEYWLLTPKLDAKLIEIDSLYDLKAVLKAFPPKNTKTPEPRYEYPDWGRIARHYDGLHLTEEGQWQTRLSVPDLYGWDSESTLWFRWAFTEVVQGGVNERV